MVGKSGGFGLCPPFSPCQFRVSGGMGHDTLHVAFNMFNKHI